MATYLLGLDEGELVAASRLIPTNHPHLLSEIFSRLCAVRGVLCAPDVAEWTRMSVVPGRRERAGHEVAGEMCCAVMEYTLAAGIRRFGGIQEAYFLTRWQHYGRHVTPLGLPEEVDGTWSVAAYFDATEEALEGVRRATGIHGSLIVRRGHPRAFRDRRGPRDHYPSACGMNDVQTAFTTSPGVFAGSDPADLRSAGGFQSEARRT